MEAQLTRKLSAHSLQKEKVRWVALSQKAKLDLLLGLHLAPLMRHLKKKKKRKRGCPSTSSYKFCPTDRGKALENMKL